MRRLALAAALVLTAALALEGKAVADQPEIWISGGSLPHAIRLAPIDAEAFQQRLSPPIRLESPPPAAGPVYAVRSAYWPQVRPGRPGVRPPADDEATYYPQSGLVEALQGTEAAWMVLDQRQQATLNRYITLGEKGLLTATPSVLEVLREDAESGGKVVVTVAARDLTATEGLRLLQSLRGIGPQPVSDLAPGAHVLGAQPSDPGTWISFSLPEGRSVRLKLDNASGRFFDYSAEQFYPVPERWLQTVLGDGSAIDALRPQEVPQDTGTGSPVWWPLMLGGGVVLLSAAFLMQRRLSGGMRA